MSQTLSDKTAEFSSELGASIKSVVKMVAQSRRCTVKPVAKAGERLIIMGNGPSLADNIRNDRDKLSSLNRISICLPIRIFSSGGRVTLMSGGFSSDSTMLLIGI